MIADLEATLAQVRDHLAQALPSQITEQQALRDLVTVGFWSSLERYEGRPTQGRLLVSPSGFEHASFPLAKLNAPRPLTPELVKRLSAASREQGASILVDRSGTTWMARGLGFPSEQYGLWVSWSRPGVIRLGYFKSALAVVHEGTAFFLGEESMFPVTEIAARLDPKKNDSQTAQAIRQVLTEMRTGHGGTLLVLPNRAYAMDGFSDSFLRGPEGDQLELLANQLAMRVSGVKTPLVTVALAHLANHDGALVITKGLGLVSAGSKIAVEESPPTVLQMIPTNPVQKRLVPPADLGGTRHQSACRFVWKYREAVAFVVSSDGPVTVMHFDGEQVVATKHFEWLLDSETVT